MKEENISKEEFIEAVNVSPLSNDELADLFGVSTSTVLRWKRGTNVPYAIARTHIYKRLIEYR